MTRYQRTSGETFIEPLKRPTRMLGKKSPAQKIIRHPTTGTETVLFPRPGKNPSEITGPLTPEKTTPPETLPSQTPKKPEENPIALCEKIHNRRENGIFAAQETAVLSVYESNRSTNDTALALSHDAKKWQNRGR